VSDDEMLGSPRATLPAKRRRDLLRYDVRNVILKKREKRGKRKGSVSRSRSAANDTSSFVVVVVVYLYICAPRKVITDKKTG
jgi:hypothetical protein